VGAAREQTSSIVWRADALSEGPPWSGGGEGALAGGKWRKVAHQRNPRWRVFERLWP
jgi:hypothetical protein